MGDKVPMMPGSRTIVRPSEKRTTRGGILLPNMVQGVSALEGTIVAAGPDCVMAEVGMECTFAPYSKYVVPAVEGPYKDHLIINEEDILFYWVDPETIKQRSEDERADAADENC